MSETLSSLPRPAAAPSHPPSHPKLRPGHLLLLALVYLRQSTPEQVRLNLESQRRQYALRDRAIGLGWAPDHVHVIDEDLGRSGADSRERTGFQRLISEVALGHVGIIFALEASRLARNNEDWQHLLRLCAVTNTLIADAENVYDPRLHDDRILLGFKGTFSEWELETLRQRLVAGAENKARRGELYTSVPVGYTLSEDLEVEQCPDQAVREAVTSVFRRFQQQGTLLGVARGLHDEGVRLPARQDSYGRKPLRWVPPTLRTVRSILTNPFYAGVYVRGRKRTVATATPEGAIVQRVQRVPLGQWTVCLPGHHSAYISWEEFLDIQKRIQANRRCFGSPGPVREGPSLLSGLLRCGPCGHIMRVNYGGVHHDAPHFACDRRDAVQDRMACQSFGGTALEQRLSGILLEVVAPHGMEAALLALEDWEEQRARQERQWDLEVARAEEKEARARRKYEEVEPGHRLVARTLEQAWERTLQALEEARRARELRRTQIPPPLTDEEKRQLRLVSHRIEELWRDSETSWKDRKEIVRLLVHHVEAWVDHGARRLTFRVHWITGKVSEDHVLLRNAYSRAREVADSDLEMIYRMASEQTDRAIAMVLTKAGRRQPSGVLWNGRAVKSVREKHGWMKAAREEQYTSLTEAMRLLHVSQDKAYRLIREGKVKAEQPYPEARWHVERASLERWLKRKK